MPIRIITPNITGPIKTEAEKLIRVFEEGSQDHESVLKILEEIKKIQMRQDLLRACIIN